MSEEKKPWFKIVTRRLWLPISWEGWAMYGGLLTGLFLILRLNGLSMDHSVNLGNDWPVLVQGGVLVAAFYWLSSGRGR